MEKSSVIKWIKVWQMLKFRKLSEFQNQLSDIRGKVLIIQYVKGLQRDTKKYIDEIYRLTFNKAKREILSGVVTIKINENLKKNNELDKNGKLLSISKSRVDNIFGKK